MKTTHAILSCSGGLDSTTLLLHMLAKGYRVEVVNFNYGSKQNKHEKKCLHRNLTYLKDRGYEIMLKEFDLSSVMGNFRSSLTREDIKTPEGEYTEENQAIIFVPNRNTIFASILFGQALTLNKDTDEPVIVSLGIHKSYNATHVTYPDCTPEWANAVFKCFLVGNPINKVTMYNPYENDYKKDILMDGLYCCNILDLDWIEVYKNTLSCYSPDKNGASCGECPTCIERLRIFKTSGLCDPAPYI